MALPDSSKLIIGTPIVLADITDHSPATANDLGTRTDQIDCTDLVAGAARQSDKIDFTANIDLEYILSVCVEWEVTPEIAAGETLEFYMAYSNSATAATANPGGVGGADAAYTGYSAGSLANSLKQLEFLGAMVMDNVITTDQAQIDMAIATFTPRQRYGTLVVYNAAASAALHSDMIETSFVFTPLTTQLQD
ncbi:hypothetical protein LCGC14_1763640 [marine sediment metagenome]|uniref:Uncharacterized protein n=1 Tax=marine sediment metagenome TaxID=412755 RepID=A0A0F9HMS5_9ZZZZ